MKTLRYILWGGVFFAAVVAAFMIWTLSQQQRQSAAVSGAPTLGAPFSLIEATGEPITERAFAGRPTALFFGFTQGPEVGPVSLYEVATLMDELGSERGDLQAFFISVDPERDTPDVLQSYISPFADNIRGITGDLPGILALAKAWAIHVEKLPLEDGDYTVDHTASVILIDRSGKFRGTIAYRENHETALEKLKLIVDL
ncbi:MAG: SCO family protein [Alphaproteobacteria bacterium]